MNLPPTFSWGGRIGAAPPNQRYPGWLNINRTQDVAISLTKIAGRHSLKAGFYNNHSYKAQNIGGTAFQGAVDFANNSQQRARHRVRFLERRASACSTSTRRARSSLRAACSTTTSRATSRTTGRSNSRLTVDYGVRFTHQQPQYDQFQQMSNFFPDKWQPRCGADSLHRGLQQRRDGLLRQHENRDEPAERADPGIAERGHQLGGHRHASPGHRQCRDQRRHARPDNGISKYGYTWPNIVVGPRFGVAYDISGQPDPDLPWRRRYLLRPSRRQHGVLDPRQPADRDL